VRLDVVETKWVQEGQDIWEVYAAVVQISKSQSEGKKRAGRPTVAGLWAGRNLQLADTGGLWWIGEEAFLQFGGWALILHDRGTFLYGELECLDLFLDFCDAGGD